MRGRLRLALILGAVGIAALLLPAPAAAQPAQPVLSANVPPWTRATDVIFSFTSDAGATFECRRDVTAYSPCSSPDSHAGLSEGAHSFQVKALAGSEESAPTSFDWTIDLTPPVLPGNAVVEATSPAGATVTFAATDVLDPAPQLLCTPGSGSTFPPGTTTVPCTATDAAGNVARGDMTVTVRDTTPPLLVPHADVVRVKQSPAGATVDYALPLAQDAADPDPDVACAPASGSLFPVGTTTVSCNATDASGNVGGPITFAVIVQEGPVPARPSVRTAVPRLSRSRAAEFTFSAEPGTTVACRLEGPSGTGTFTPCASASGQTYSGLADGAYLFTVQVTNGIGNVSQANYAWTVDRTPPAAVKGFAARGRDGLVRLRWLRPTDLDFRRVRIERARARSGRTRLVAERRTAVRFTDRRAANEVRYRYVIRSLDRAGNRSRAVSAIARPSAVVSPAYGSLVRRAPLVDWRSVRRATYYNMQLWRNGRKLLSVWPLRSGYRLRSSWTFRGRRHSLTPGRLTVYVWPGFGAKAAVRYGPLLGSTSFRVG
ncbi:MAG: HYR domain-containing protein [Gaiellaceae bacterium]